MSLGLFRPESMSLGRKLVQVNWGLVLLLAAISAIGFAMLYSAADGSFQPWASRQMARFALGMGLLLVIALVDLRFWLRWAYLIYLGALVLLVAVEILGTVGMGAQRWISLGPLNLQPSELMKIALVVVLARYYHALPQDSVSRFRYLLWPLVLTLLPALLVMRQPDLGTAILLVMIAAGMLFMAGVRLWLFGLVIGLAAAAAPIAWQFLKPYQKNRIFTFFDPGSDPLGSGYHILQSKIALGSGGVFGKGFMAGSQSHLNFLPEKQTDFIFTMLAEEFGMLGAAGLLGLYLLVLVYGFAIALRAQSHFGRLLAMGISISFFLYVFINMAMVMGLVPVVGVPLPLISYGGTSMLTLLMGFGLLIGVHVHRELIIGRAGQGTRD